jgi:hypothetical protein
VGYFQGRVNAANNGALSMPNIAITATGEGLERSSRQGPIEAIKSKVTAAATTLTEGGITRDAVILKGSTRIFGKPLGQLTLP